MHVASTEGCNILETVEQKDFIDQSGTVKPRDRFTGGSGKNPERRYGSFKAIDPTPAKPRPPGTHLSELFGRARHRGNLAFLGHYDGAFAAYDARHSRKCGTSTWAPASTRRRTASPSTASNTSRLRHARPSTRHPRRSCGGGGRSPKLGENC
jgi:hypothetical protein